jgi:hypothetical protein
VRTASGTPLLRTRRQYAAKAGSEEGLFGAACSLFIEGRHFPDRHAGGVQLTENGAGGRRRERDDHSQIAGEVDTTMHTRLGAHAITTWALIEYCLIDVVVVSTEAVHKWVGLAGIQVWLFALTGF